MNINNLESLPPHWEDAALVFEALGSPIRQRILLLFDPNEELSIKTIVELFPYSRTSINFHLTTLEKAGLVRRRKTGREVLYRLDKAPLINALQRLLRYAQTEE